MNVIYIRGLFITYAYVLKSNHPQTLTYASPGWETLLTPFRAPSVSSHIFVVMIHWLSFIVLPHTDLSTNSLLLCCAFFKHYVIWTILYDSSMICFLKKIDNFKINFDMSGYSSSVLHYRIIFRDTTIHQSSFLVHQGWTFPVTISNTAKAIWCQIPSTHGWTFLWGRLRETNIFSFWPVFLHSSSFYKKLKVLISR